MVWRLGVVVVFVGWIMVMVNCLFLDDDGWYLGFVVCLWFWCV